MIRREHCAADGKPSWILISQVEHARLAHALAKSWDGSFAGAAECESHLLEAIFHHDDGWYRWETMQEIDPGSGAPLDFMEMPLDEALGIWVRSIAEAVDYGPMVAYLVNRHFSALLRHFDTWRAHAAKKALAERFLTEADAKAAVWLSAWQTGRPSTRTAEVAQCAVAWLQWFDALSLWFCVAPRTQPHTLQTPSGEELRLVPESDERVSARPWPWSDAPLTVEAHGRCVDARRYDSAVDLAESPQRRVTLSWQVAPG